jgi:hypothetical protein
MAHAYEAGGGITAVLAMPFTPTPQRGRQPAPMLAKGHRGVTISLKIKGKEKETVGTNFHHPRDFHTLGRKTWQPALGRSQAMMRMTNQKKRDIPVHAMTIRNKSIKKL